jgi:protein involved in polysaccharide export with SLBB domain
MKQSCRKTLLQGVLSLVILVSVSQFAIPGLAQADPSRVGQEAAPAPQTDEKTTLFQAITIASGVTPMAERSKIVVSRFAKDGGGRIKMKASYDDIVLRDGSTQDIELKPGDQIVVPSETTVLAP